jgi:hypothetical protein
MLSEIKMVFANFVDFLIGEFFRIGRWKTY